MNSKISKLAFLWLLTGLAMVSGAGAQTLPGPKASVRVLLVSASMDTTVVMPGQQASGGLTVPLEVIMEASIESDADTVAYVMFPQWTVTRTVIDDGKESTSVFLKRQESRTEFEFTEYGQFCVNFEWSYRKEGDTGTIQGETLEPMTFTIDDSEIRLYNAFSPNGDGINDVYCIYMRSIVKANIAIFNRWGQTLKTVSGSMEEILGRTNPQQESDGGYMLELWDGTWNGSTVNDGVYFINVQATGAGGRKYSEKADINVLKGLGEN